MRYEINGEVFYEIDEVLNYCIEDDYHYDDDEFEDWVNELYGSIDICGETYYAYDILEEFNDDNWRYAKEKYCEDQNDIDRENAEYDLSNAEDGETVEIQRYTVYVSAEDVSIEEHNESIERCRKSIESAKQEAEKDDDDFTNLFQVLGA